MQNLTDQDLPPFLRLARLLDAGLFAESPSDAFAALVPKTDAEWEALFTSASNDRALAPLCYIFASKPAFAALAGAEELSAMREWHAALAFRAGEIRKQIVELTDLFERHDRRLMLLKGASRLFDGLYPDISCRYSVDIDLMVEEASMFYEAIGLGYKVLEDATFDMAAIRAGDISVATGPEFHHLPPLYRDGEQASVELHIRPFSSKFQRLSIPGLWKDATPVDGHPSLLIPSVPHQIIINIVHTLLHGLAKEQFQLSARDLFEGHVLYSMANAQQRQQVEAHFRNNGRGGDFDLWNSVCYRTFQNPVYAMPESRAHARFFARLVATQGDPKAWFRLRLTARLREFLFEDLWHWSRLKIRLRHFASAAFWRRAISRFRQSRHGRK